MTSLEATKVLKRELRKRIRGSLKALPRPEIERQSAYLTDVLKNHQAYLSAKTIALYSSQPTEMETSGLMRHAFESNKRVFLPRVLSMSKRQMVMLEVRSLADLDSFDRGAYNIPEPPVDDGRLQAPRDIPLDLVVMPGVAFDLTGRRLGHGMGFYDVFLEHYKAHHTNGGLTTAGNTNMPKLIALALSVQVVPLVPVDDNDWLVDEVVVAPEK